jgi:hypothetical protein
VRRASSGHGGSGSAHYSGYRHRVERPGRQPTQRRVGRAHKSLSVNRLKPAIFRPLRILKRPESWEGFRSEAGTTANPDLPRTLAARDLAHIGWDRQRKVTAAAIHDHVARFWRRSHSAPSTPRTARPCRSSTSTSVKPRYPTAERTARPTGPRCRLGHAVVAALRHVLQSQRHRGLERARALGWRRRQRPRRA